LAVDFKFYEIQFRKVVVELLPIFYDFLLSKLAKYRVRVNQHIHFLPNVFRFLLPPPRLLALPTEAWQGAES
jgi:hypothetical protein